MKRQGRTNHAAPPAKITSGLLQRKCACGGQSGLAGECAECNENKQKLQRSANGPAREQVPQVVYEVLGTSGQPLDKATRTSMEEHFGHNFSNVRVHTDARAAESANAVNALAYTVGHNVVFAEGKYTPATNDGRQLIAHELTHVMQQEQAGTIRGGALTLDSPHSESERQAGAAAASITQSASTHVASSANPAATVQRQPAPLPPAKGPAKPSPKAPAKEPPKKTYPVENCPFPSDFKDEHESGSNMMCVADASFEKAPECNLTDKHLELINAAKEVARKRVEKAESRMHWLGGPEYAQRVASRIFKGAPPDSATIKDTLAKMVKILSGTAMRFRGATCADPLCESKGQHAAAYESGPTEPVALCPRSFLPGYLPKLPRTIIHEAVHLAGIDINPDIEEMYCDGKGCEEPCQDATSADAWALFIDCLGGPLIKPKTP